MNILNKTKLIAFFLLLTFAVSPTAGFAQATGENVMANAQAMDKVFEQVQRVYQANPKKGDAAVQSLTESQKQWKKDTVKTCQSAGPEKSTECMNNRVLERTKALQAMLSTPQ